MFHVTKVSCSGALVVSRPDLSAELRLTPASLVKCPKEVTVSKVLVTLLTASSHYTHPVPRTDAADQWMEAMSFEHNLSGLERNLKRSYYSYHHQA